MEQACTRKKLFWGDTASGQIVDSRDYLNRFKANQEDIGKYVNAYREYCWTVKSIDDFQARCSIFWLWRKRLLRKDICQASGAPKEIYRLDGSCLHGESVYLCPY